LPEIETYSLKQSIPPNGMRKKNEWKGGKVTIDNINQYAAAMTSVSSVNLSEMTAGELSSLKRELELQVASIDREMAKRGTAAGASAKPTKPKTVVHRMTDDPVKGVAIKDIKHILDSKGIAYPSSAKKQALWEIVQNHRLVRETKRYAQLRKLATT
jgi:hypothetical protein